MDKVINVRNGIVCQNNDSVFNYYGWPTVARLPGGALATAASGFRMAHVCPFGKAILCYSHDDGETWSEPTVVIDTPLDDRDSGVASFGDGRVIFTSFNNSVQFQRDTLEQYLEWHSGEYAPGGARERLITAYLDLVGENGGEGAAQDKYMGATYRISEDGGYTFGEIKRMPVLTTHGPAVFGDGSLLFVGNRYTGRPFEHFGRCIECYRMDGQSGEAAFLSRIDCEGVGAPVHEPHAVVLPDGKIVVHIRVDDNKDVFTIYQTESRDGGKSFAKPRPIGIDNGSPAFLTRHSSGVLISSYGHRKAPFGQRVMFSKDGGESWDVDYILRQDGNDGDLGYPSTVERRDGSLLTVYYQAEKGRRNCVIMQSIWELPI